MLVGTAYIEQATNDDARRLSMSTLSSNDLRFNGRIKTAAGVGLHSDAVHSFFLAKILMN